MAEAERPLRWKLSVNSNNAGGTSNVTQRGLANGRNQPVASVIVSHNSQGDITLLVFDGETEVSRDVVRFDGAHPSSQSTD